MSELTERWNDPGVRESRKLYTEYRPEGIIALHDKLFADPDRKWEREDLEETLELHYKLGLWPNLIEVIGVLWSEGAVDTSFVYRMWGPGILRAWNFWKEPVDHLREVGEFNAPVYRYFQRLAEALQTYAASDEARQ